MQLILKMRLGILLIISGIITALVGIFWWSMLHVSPTHIAVASQTLLVYSVFGAITSIVGLILLTGWYFSRDLHQEISTSRS